jgi:hypothetical protein
MKDIRYSGTFKFPIISDFGRSLAGQFGFGLTVTEYLQMALRLPLKEVEYSASALVSAELFGFVCSLVLKQDNL